MNDVGGMYSFQLASEEVERRLGVSWGAAQKTVLDWCESGALRFENVAMGGPNVSYSDLQRCLEAQASHNKIDKPKSLTLRRVDGKQPRIIERLEKMFPDGVPAPGLAPRKALKADLLQLDKSLEPLDEATLKSAIDSYNSRFPN
ncbi:hypothetical protein [Methylosinus sp. RM1]|uniref:hypothetical protein n=1 Tax=Methylosinus sp. RM1 TaxID=2583817 RepID=UPI00140867E9|nr:hypothetical protein [Methylosinus sp. RM1]